MGTLRCLDEHALVASLGGYRHSDSALRASKRRLRNARSADVLVKRTFY
jgi:hypothetical protein